MKIKGSKIRMKIPEPTGKDLQGRPANLDPSKIFEEMDAGKLETLARQAKLRFESKFRQVGPYE